mgnify:FL=1
MKISTSSIHKEQSKKIDPKKLEHFFSGQGGQPGSSGSSDKVGPDGLYFNLNDNAGRGSNGHNGVHAGSNGDNDLFSTSGGLNSPFRYVSDLNFLLVKKIRENNMSQLSALEAGQITIWGFCSKVLETLKV